MTGAENTLISLGDNEDLQYEYNRRLIVQWGTVVEQLLFKYSWLQILNRKRQQKN